MITTHFTIRTATLADLPAMLELYRHLIPARLDADSSSIKASWYRAPGWPVAAQKIRLMLNRR